jgi:hypothetical protein
MWVADANGVESSFLQVCVPEKIESEARHISQVSWAGASFFENTNVRDQGVTMNALLGFLLLTWRLSSEDDIKTPTSSHNVLLKSFSEVY